MNWCWIGFLEQMLKRFVEQLKKDLEMTLSGLNSETIFRTERSLIAQTCSCLYTPYTVFQISFQRFWPNVYSEPLKPLGELWGEFEVILWERIG